MKKIIGILILLIFYHFSYSQARQEKREIEIYFDLDSDSINENILNNRYGIKELFELINQINRDTLLTLQRIDVNGYSSPDGSASYNQKLSQERANTAANYLVDSLMIDRNIIDINACGVAWQQLKNMVAASSMAYRGEIVNIIDNTPEETWKKINPTDKWSTLVDSRNSQLKNLNGGEPYRYMQANFFPFLRKSSVITIYYQSEQVDLTVVEPVEEKESDSRADIVEDLTQVPPPNSVIEPDYNTPLFALKTNLIFDVATIVNVELEIPIGNQWSIAGEWIFPWWIWNNNRPDSKRNRTQLLNYNLEGKYWFGDRTNSDVMTGWFAGLYAGGGDYDFERNAKGYQGEFFIAAGMSGGYAHTINRSGTLRMEYSLGIGYLKTNYRYYEAMYGTDNTWHPIRQRRGTYKWFGPTKAKASLVWLINKNMKGGRR